MNVKLGNLNGGLVSSFSAFVASLCCLLPLTIVLLDVGGGAFMMVTMQYRTVFLPVGVIGVALGYYLYFRDRRRCITLGCTFVSRKPNLALLLFATVVVGLAIILDVFPELTSGILQGVM